MRATTAVLMVLASLAGPLLPAYADFPKKVKTKGKITTIAPGKVMVKDATNNVRTFNILPNREVGVSVQGGLALSDLKPGMLVRVEGPLKANSVEGEVANITVYSPNDGYEIGIIQDSKDAPATVTGNIKLVKDGTLTLVVGKKRITARRAKELAIGVDSKDYSLAPVGSLIEAEGYETKDGSVNAKKIVITLGEKKEPTPQDGKTPKTAKKKEEKR